jgi:tripartite-type tricarboxylate transporter receptor subunit TctC
VQAELVRTLQDPGVNERLTGQALTVVGSTPEEFGRFLAVEMDRWGKVVRENSITAN